MVLGSCPEAEMVQNGTETDHLEHSGGLVPEYLKWYQHWQFGASGDHGSNICIEIGTPAIRRRAEGCLYVWEIVFTVQRDPCTSLETAFTVQRALCTFRGEGHPVQKGHPCHPGAAKVGPNSLKFKSGSKGSQSSLELGGAGFGPCAPKLGPNIRIACE